MPILNPSFKDIKEDIPPLKRYCLDRLEDVNDVSGLGIVVTGVQFSNGKVAQCWNTDTSSISIWDSIEDVMAVHGHDGKTVLRWID